MKSRAVWMLGAMGLMAGGAYAQENAAKPATGTPSKPAVTTPADVSKPTLVASIPNVQITGVAVSSTGRVFVCAPFWRESHDWSVAEVMPDGSFVPFPPGAYNSWEPGEGKQMGVGFVCVQSVHCDEKDTLWVLDSGSPLMQGTLLGDDSGGGPKLVRIDLKTNRVIRPYLLRRDVVPQNGYPNDVRVDTEKNLAYITDSGMGAIVLLDLRHGQARRVAANSPSTKADPSVVPVINGKQLKKTDGSAFLVHSDGLALDKKNGWLYYQALTGRKLYRLKTSALEAIMKGANDRLDERIAEALEDLGETVVTDGMEVDDAGNVYFTAIEHNAIMYRTPAGEMRTLVKDDAIQWPDAMAIRNGELYFTTSQIHLTDWFNPTGTTPSEPYKIFKVKLPAAAEPKPTSK
jgi:sugar lactone lactonase YvrE